MRNKIVAVMSAAAVAVAVTGCASSGSGNDTNPSGRLSTTGVTLSQNNFKMIKPNASGSSHGFALLGLIPIVNPTVEVAKEHLYATVGQDLTGRAVALANQSEYHSTVYLILFSVPKVTVSADVIEFKDAAAATK
jgi:predicted component of type VI protein secretion system